jgi:hypothetical protein
LIDYLAEVSVRKVLAGRSGHGLDSPFRRGDRDTWPLDDVLVPKRPPVLKRFTRAWFETEFHYPLLAATPAMRRRYPVASTAWSGLDLIQIAIGIGIDVLLEGERTRSSSAWRGCA